MTEKMATEKKTTEKKTTEKKTTEQKATEKKATEKKTTDKKNTEQNTTKKKTTEKKTSELEDPTSPHLAMTQLDESCHDDDEEGEQFGVGKDILHRDGQERFQMWLLLPTWIHVAHFTSQQLTKARITAIVSLVNRSGKTFIK